MANDRLIGDSHNNALYGFGGNDTISGGAGNDTLDGGHGRNLLTGGPGRDTFVFDTAMIPGFAGDTPRNTVTDFQPHKDTILLDIQIYNSLTYTGTLSPANFLAAPHAVYGHNGQQFLVYDTVTGNLYYDPTGMGPSPTFREIAHFDHAPKLHASDIHLIMQEFLLAN
jgi:Ca2+-binding RTX toxin-like protein